MTGVIRVEWWWSRDSSMWAVTKKGHTTQFFYHKKKAIAYAKERAAEWGISEIKVEHRETTKIRTIKAEGGAS